MRHLTTLAVLTATVALAACGSTTEPLVDRRGVDDTRYTRDLAGCRQSSGPSILPFGKSVGSCMTAKGYKVLMQ